MFWLSGHVGKRLDKKAKINFKIDDVANWETNYYNTHSAQYLKIKNNQENKFVQLIEYNLRNNFAEKSYPKCDGETSLRHFKNSVSLTVFFHNIVNRLDGFFIHCVNSVHIRSF